MHQNNNKVNKPVSDSDPVLKLKETPEEELV